MNKINNPFNISFGEQPKSFIIRKSEIDQIISSFSSPNPESKAYVISGPRGCGKTVLLSNVKDYYNNQKDWITVDLNPYTDMLEQLAAKIYEEGKIKHVFIKSEFSFSFHGLSFQIKGENPVSNIFSLLDIIFKTLFKKNTKVLITIDDIAPSEQVKLFVHSFQSFIREKYLVYLVMTGLYENVSDLSNTSNLTFLLRTPKIFLQKLSLKEISIQYKHELNIDEKTSINLAKITNGYAYGYQLLGNLMYKNGCVSLNEDILDKFDSILDENVYSKIWENLTKNERNILFALEESKDGSVKEILEITKLTNSALQVYKKNLSNKGLIDCSTRGQISFSLPRFKEYTNFQKQLL